MRNYFKGLKIPFDEVCDGIKKIGFLYHLSYMEEEKDHIIDYLDRLSDDEKKEYLSNNISSFNRYLNKMGLSNDVLKNTYAYIGLIGLLENGFSLLQDLDMSEVVLLSSYVYNFITHPDYPENLKLPFLSEKQVLSSIIEKEPTSLDNQQSILGSVCDNFSLVETKDALKYVDRLTEDEIELLKATDRHESTKGFQF